MSVAYIGSQSRTERLRKTKIGTEVTHVTRHTWHHFQGQKVKGQGHQAALLTAVLARQAAVAVGVGTCWPWRTAATLPSVRPREALRRPRGRRGAGHIVAAARLQPVQTRLASSRAHTLPRQLIRGSCYNWTTLGKQTQCCGVWPKHNLS